MGKLGFLFGDLNEGVVIFTDKNNFEGEIIVGEIERLSKDCKFYFLDKSLNLEENFIFENTKFKYGKISLAQKTIIDFEFLSFWFSARKYKEIRQIFDNDLQNINLDFLVLKVVKLYDYFR